MTRRLNFLFAILALLLIPLARALSGVVALVECAVELANYDANYKTKNEYWSQLHEKNKAGLRKLLKGKLEELKKKKLSPLDEKVLGIVKTFLKIENNEEGEEFLYYHITALDKLDIQTDPDVLDKITTAIKGLSSGRQTVSNSTEPAIRPATSELPDRSHISKINDQRAAGTYGTFGTTSHSHDFTKGASSGVSPYKSSNIQSKPISPSATDDPEEANDSLVSKPPIRPNSLRLTNIARPKTPKLATQSGRSFGGAH